MHDHVITGGGQASQPLCPRDARSNGDGIWAIVLQGGKPWDADKELLMNR